MGNLIAPPLKTSPQLAINLATQNYYPLDILQGTVNLRISNPITSLMSGKLFKKNSAIL